MPNYQNAKIYALRSHQTKDIYIGSTAELLCRRIAKHKYDFKTKRTHITSKHILKYDDCYIELIEEFPCNNRMELHRREGYYIREMDCVNKCIAGRTDKEYRTDNADKISAVKKIYRDNHLQEEKQRGINYRNNNKELVREKKRLYREQNKEKIAEKKRKEYLENKEKRMIQSKLNYEKNKEAISLRSRERVNCDGCNLEMSRGALQRHKTRSCCVN